MPLKKSDLYASLWASCDELRGGMDASQYKDYVLFMLFIKYVSDKYGSSNDFAPPVTIPKGASFADMVRLKGKADIGDKINTQIIQPLIDANTRLARTDFPDFNDPNKLGEGQAKVDRLTNLVGIFEKPELDFSGNRAEHDDILGDAYEYLMRHFATESGKSKGQFYTPAEVSRVIAQAIGISPENAKASTTAYDPTCGSGSLLLKVAAQAGKPITLEGQEMDVTTAGLARMNMILHDFPTANIQQGNTLAAPKFKEGESLRTYDYVVANPPFSVKTWSVGLTPDHDPFQRFAWGVPPPKQGDYAFLLHIIRSLKSNGKGACILPHGVLFRGNAEAAIRQALVRSGILKGIIGLPANLFYGTGIPACILILDKENAASRRGIFMIDASKGFLKDGNKNRLRDQDIHRIVDTFTRQASVDHYARLVPVEEIADPKNDFNLNLPRYIDTSDPEDLHDIDAHLRGGIPARDVDALDAYWQVLPGVRAHLFTRADRPGYFTLTVPPASVKAAILDHEEFEAFTRTIQKLFATWSKKAAAAFSDFGRGKHPKHLVEELSESLLAAFQKAPLVDAYAIYQHLMDAWSATLQDDAYLVAADGWVAKPQLIVEVDKKGKRKEKGWACDLIPKELLLKTFFEKELARVVALEGELESASAALANLEEEQGGEEGLLSAADKLAKTEVTRRLKEIKGDADAADEAGALTQWLTLSEAEAGLRKKVRDHTAELDVRALGHYATLSEDVVKRVVIERKWIPALMQGVKAEIERVSHRLTGRVRELSDRYATPLPTLSAEVEALSAKVEEHLAAMGFAHDTVAHAPDASPVNSKATKARLPGFGGEWARRRLGELGTFLKGSGIRKDDAQSGDLPCVRYGELYTHHHDWIKRHYSWVSREVASAAQRLRKGDVLFAGSGETKGEIGKCASFLADCEAYAGGDIVILRPQGVDSLFLGYLCNTPAIATQKASMGQGDAVVHISALSLAAIQVTIPPIAEQSAIASVLSDMDAEIAALERRRDKTKLLKQAMMQELLTGKTRLK